MSNKTPLILVANPGSASRKYGLYRGDAVIADLHFEWEGGKVICTVQTEHDHFVDPVGAQHLDEVISHVEAMLLRCGALRDGDKIDGIGLRLVAPSSYFLGNHHLTPSVVEKLRDLERVAPLHIGIILKELTALEAEFKSVPIYGISDSGFHASKPDYAWNYGISLEDADKYEIKRFGYHGLSVQSAIHHLKRHDKLANKIVLAHLGSGGSVTALHGGKSLDNTMGYSPLEGLVMATRSGSIDYSATRALQISKGLDDEEMETYLNHESGLKGIGGSPDIRDLRLREQAGDNQARLALATYVYGVQKGIAQMTAALGGADALVFTGTVGERSAVIRERIVNRLHYLDFVLDHRTNAACTDPTGLEVVSSLATSKPIYVVHADEAAEIAKQVANLL
jgi:acetate kinase